MCKNLDQNTCYECKVQFKGAENNNSGRMRILEYRGVAITCKCGEVEYFISPQMPFHKIIIPFDRRWVKGITKMLNAGHRLRKY